MPKRKPLYDVKGELMEYYDAKALILRRIDAMLKAEELTEFFGPLGEVHLVRIDVNTTKAYTEQRCLTCKAIYSLREVRCPTCQTPSKLVKPR